MTTGLFNLIKIFIFGLACLLAPQGDRQSHTKNDFTQWPDFGREKHEKLAIPSDWP